MLRRRAWAALAGVTVLALLLLAPLVDDLLRAFVFHVGPHPAGESADGGGNLLDIVVGGLAILSGSTHWPGAMLFWIVVIRGALVHRSNDRRSFRYVSIVVLFHFVVMILTAVPRVSHLFPVAFARYLVVLLPFLYCWAAVGTLAPVGESRLARAAWTRWAVAALLLGLWIGSGPYRAIAESGFQTSFAGSKQPFTEGRQTTGLVRGERLYEDLPRGSAETVVLESPGDEHDSILRLYADNQRIHKSRVIVTEFPLVDGARLAFRNMIRRGPSAILRSDADYLVIHLHLFEEVGERFGSFPRHLDARAANHELEALQLARELSGVWGGPDHEDEWIVVWDLGRVRSSK